MKPATNSLAKKKHAIPHVYIILLIVILLAVANGKHTGGIPDAQHPLPGQLPVDISGQSGKVSNMGDVIFLVQNGLIEVGDRPALRDIDGEKFA